MPGSGINVTRQINPHTHQEHCEYRHENQVYRLARCASFTRHQKLGGGATGGEGAFGGVTENDLFYCCEHVQAECDFVLVS